MFSIVCNCNAEVVEIILQPGDNLIIRRCAHVDCAMRLTIKTRK